MSHLKERKEKDCLNCNANVEGRYCHICGQENIEPKESVWHLINHFFQDITHFDGKFFSTLRLLIFRPGFLTGEYIRGRRASYLNPIRMYIFTSALFFLLFFTFFKGGKETLTQNSTINGKTLHQVQQMDSASFADFTSDINEEDGRPAVPMTRKEFQNYYDSAINKVFNKTAGSFTFFSTNYKSKEEYDSLLKKGAVNHDWLERKLNYKAIEMNEKYKDNSQGAFKELIEIFLHKLPQLMFVSLPLMALLLTLLYIRRKEFYYVSHGIFSIHLYIFTFIIMLASLALGKINNSDGWTFINVTRMILILLIFFYMYKAMRNFYGQSRIKTIIKFILLNVISLIGMGLLFIIFLLLSFFDI